MIAFSPDSATKLIRIWISNSPQLLDRCRDHLSYAYNEKEDLPRFRDFKRWLVDVWLQGQRDAASEREKTYFETD